MTVINRLLLAVPLFCCLLTVAILPNTAKADSAIMPPCRDLTHMAEYLTDLVGQCDRTGWVDPESPQGEKLDYLIMDLINVAEATYDYELGDAVAALQKAWKTQAQDQFKKYLDQTTTLFTKVLESECGN